MIYLGNDEGKYIVLPRGLREEIQRRFDKAEIGYEIEDKRTGGRKNNISFKGNLRESQIPAVETMLENGYGSMNLLSKEDAEDNLMRVCSKDIAEELLEMTFGSEVKMQEW